MLNGFLTAHGVFPEKTHDLLQLCEHCEELDNRFEQFVNSCVELSPYGVQIRYPSTIESDENDMYRAIDEARCICAFVLNDFCELFGESESEEQRQEM